ncbi:hypothetical protein [Sinorhizobium psoraleae]|uniref:hypothetical protein n=1 Tax=Sinorhizobium psoraleae TaxID=520838 RepID=UPI00156A1FF4
MSGRRPRLFDISKRGDRSLRTLMIHGARAALDRAGGKQDPPSLWPASCGNGGPQPRGGRSPVRMREFSRRCTRVTRPIKRTCR